MNDSSGSFNPFSAAKLQTSKAAEVLNPAEDTEQNSDDAPTRRFSKAILPPLSSRGKPSPAPAVTSKPPVPTFGEESDGEGGDEEPTQVGVVDDILKAVSDDSGLGAAASGSGRPTIKELAVVSGQSIAERPTAELPSVAAGQEVSRRPTVEEPAVVSGQLVAERPTVEGPSVAREPEAGLSADGVAPAEDEDAAISVLSEGEAYQAHMESIFAEMTPEEREAYEQEQLELALADLTPEEREAYEQEQLERAAEQERVAYEAAAARRLAFIETYAGEAASKPKSSHTGLMIGIAVAAAVIIGVVVVLMTSGSESPVQAAAQEEAAQEVRADVVEVATPLNYFDVNIDIPSDATLYINGVRTAAAGSHKFVRGHRNTIFAYRDGMVPFFKTFEKGADFSSPIVVDFESDELYLKSKVSFKFRDPSVEGFDLKATFNGRTLPRFPMDVHDVVLGRPHILVLEKPGFGKHMHIIWPDSPVDNLVMIPALTSENNARGGSTLELKKFPVRTAQPYSVRIAMGDTVYNAPVIVNAPAGALVEYSIARKQRIPLAFSIYPRGFGTVSFDTDLLADSLGESRVAFKTPKNSDIQVCFRRVGELVCPSMTGETVIPSGNGWEAFAYVGPHNSKRVLRNPYHQELQPKRGYVFGVDVKGDNFVLKQEGYKRL
ncbi:MAG: hypothetical protein FWC40_03030 [Proteobacteria bacterium]|nr:hypothetical protein [Pseudomonadota bacterium]